MRLKINQISGEVSGGLKALTGDIGLIGRWISA
jgi:hypothetical protein